MRLIIAGGRDFDSLQMMVAKLDALINVTMERIVIISGTARGADSMGEQFAKLKGFHCEQYPAQWDKYGRSAGYKRNEQMADQATHCVVFWDGKSRGSKHMIDIAKKKGLELRVIRYTNHEGNIYSDADERRT